MEAEVREIMETSKWVRKKKNEKGMKRKQAKGEDQVEWKGSVRSKY